MASCNNAIPGLIFYDSLVNNNLVELRKCVDVHKIDTNARLSHVRKRNHTDLCPVHLVTYKGHFAMLHFLIQNGVNVHQPTSTLQRRAVHFAAMRHQVSCLQMLLNAGAQLDPRDTFGNTPLHYGAEDGDGGLLSLLLNNGAAVDSQDITNKTPLMKATRSGRLWAVRRLITFGANINLKDRNDETALHFACRQGSSEIISMLIKAGARLNVQNQIGLTPMMEAVSYNQREAVSILVKQRGLDLYKRDFCAGDTALHMAVRKNYMHMVEILLHAGNWFIEYNYNNVGESFLHDVIVYNRLELLRLFLAYNYDLDRPTKRSLACRSTMRNEQTSGCLALNQLAGTETRCNTRTLAVVPTGQTSVSELTVMQEKVPFQLALERGHMDMARILADVGCYRIKLPTSTQCSVDPQTSLLIKAFHILPTISTSAANYTSSTIVRRCCALFEVKSLKKWCRRVIRKTLGFRITDALPQLPLPIALKDFLLLRDVDWSVPVSTNHLSYRINTNTSIGDSTIIVPPTLSSSSRNTAIQ